MTPAQALTASANAIRRMYEAEVERGRLKVTEEAINAAIWATEQVEEE